MANKHRATKGPQARAVQSRAERDAVALGKLEAWIDEILDGHVTCTKCRKEFEAKELQPSAVALLKARYDKLRPSLSAVEQTTIEPAQQLTEEQILLKLQALITAHPDLVQHALAMNAKAVREGNAAPRSSDSGSSDAAAVA